MSASLHKILVADAHLAEGKFLLEEQTLNKEKPPIYRVGTRRKKKTKKWQIKTTVKFNK
jgi:hypothetical protein